MAWQFGEKQPSGLSKWRLQWATRGTSGDFGPVGDLYGPTDRADADFGLAVSAEDTAAIAIPSADGVRTAMRPSGSGFSALQKIPGSGSSRDADIAFTTGDKAIAMWHQYAVGAPSQGDGRRAPAGRALRLRAPAQRRRQGDRAQPSQRPRDRRRGQRHGVVRARREPDEPGRLRRCGGCRRCPTTPWRPRSSASACPATARVGQTIAMGAPARDRWTGATVTWDFGDGGTEEGENLVYAYAKAGTYTVRITATDGAGNTRTTTRTVQVDRRARAAHLTCHRPALPRFGGSEPGRAHQQCRRSPINGSG